MFFGMSIFFGFFIIGIGSLVLSIMTVVDASKYPDWAFQKAGSTKFVWQILPIIFIFVCGPVGGVMGLIWYTSKRVAVADAARSGPPAYGYGAPPGWAPPPGGSWGPPGTPPPSPGPTPPPPGAPPPWPPAAEPTPESPQ